uniref:Uncharacterized protein n=1 Tax=Chrysemys picta bellii TaxID=8478 RepID=A0A8C3FBR3_CHRPI
GNEQNRESPSDPSLQALQCHFTWNFEIRDKVDAAHILQTLALRIAHTHYQNQPTFLAMQAYLYHLQGQYEDALQSLREAEEILQRDHPDNFPRQGLVLVIYGNYAWLYYHLAHYDLVELYLDKVRKICSSLKSRSPYAAQIPEIHAQKGWSLLAAGFRNGREATECFQMALREDEANGEFLAGLAIAAFASWTHSPNSASRNAAREKLGAIIREQQQNYEAKVYLAKTLKSVNREQAEALLEDVVQNSLDPEVLRNAAKSFQREFVEKSISILERAISLNPNYHLLHYDLDFYPHLPRVWEECFYLLDLVLSGAQDSVQEVNVAEPLCNSDHKIIKFNISGGGGHHQRSPTQKPLISERGTTQ